ncbi:FINGER (CCCH TYPE) PROTEIN putative-RELATED [Salix purpurea]|uniref:FINGER (CCCH TYPE) PROTEIN putative-RELATED n=1 Tax=Salix purpurea TaxID=77065 RepID=A0A9Q0VA35_SALPP|nr:FINGER (CCCH TYPE) PROTEIN putative-RELATED [Salix purpurea]
MESPELPECPVCLSTYDGECTIPRVLPCGHTTCESCLKNIPQKYPLTIRCPACTQLVKYPSQQGPSSLPKNIDLLRLIQQLQDHNPEKPNNKIQIDKPVLAQDFDFFVSPLWSDEFYTSWKNWVLDSDDVFVEDKERGYGLLKEGNKKVKVKLFKVGNDGVLLSGKVKGCVFKLSYVAKVMNFLNGMKEEERDELGFILKICAKQGRICKGCGLWCDLEDGVLYFVCERLNGNVLDMLGEFENGLRKDGLSSFAMIGMEMYEAVIGLHLEGLIVGSLGVSCFELDDFGHVSLSLSEVLVVRRAVHEGVMELCSGEKSLSVQKLGRLVGEILKKEVFVSPEVLFGILKREGIEVECGSIRYPIGLGSDVWTLACTVLRMLIGKEFFEELVDSVDSIISKRSEDSILDCSGLCTGLMEKGIVHMLLICGSVLGDLFIRHQHDTSVLSLGEAIHEENKEHFRVLGELCWVPMKRSTLKKTESADNSSGENQDQSDDVRLDKDIAEALVEEKVKFKEMQGHIDSVTGFAIGGGFLFSSSFDKTVQVWSLQDFSQIHTFKGHEHKVMAVIYVDEELPIMH